MKLSLLCSGSLPVDSDVFTNTFINSLILKKQISCSLKNTNTNLKTNLSLLCCLWLEYKYHWNRVKLLWRFERLEKFLKISISILLGWYTCCLLSYRRIAEYKVGSCWRESINDLSISLTHIEPFIRNLLYRVNH